MTDQRAGNHVHAWVLTQRKRRPLRGSEIITFSCANCPETWTKEWFTEPPIYSGHDTRFAGV